MLLAQGRACLLLRNFAAGEACFRRLCRVERSSQFNSANLYAPLPTALSQFYLGQALEGTGRPIEAAAEYRKFVARFPTPSAALPQAAEARAALQRLGL